MNVILTESFEDSDQLSFSDLRAKTPGRSPSLPARLDKLAISSPAARSTTSSVSSSLTIVFQLRAYSNYYVTHSTSSGILNSSFVASLPGPVTRSRKSRLSLDARALAPTGPHVGNHVPLGMRALLSSEDEPDDDLEWGRLSELQRRNTLCLPHLKTSYPVETQRRTIKEMSDEEMKQPRLPDPVFSLGSERRKRRTDTELEGTPEAKRKVRVTF